MARTRLYPPSVDPGFPKLPPRPAGWTRRTFGELVEAVERPVILQPHQTYLLLTAKRNRGGLVRRAELAGNEILTKAQFEAKTGDFVLSRRQIIHGACGIVPPELDGAIVSGEYAVLRTLPGLSVAFLEEYAHTPYFQRTCFHSSHGVDVEKMVFKLEKWLAWPFDVPPLAEQDRIVEVLSSVNQAVATSEWTLREAELVKQAFAEQLLSTGLPSRHTAFRETAIGSIPKSWGVVPLGSLIDRIETGRSPKCELQPASHDEWGVLKVSAVSWGVFLPEENKRLPSTFSPRAGDEVRPGDVLVSRANTPELVGRSVLIGATRPKLLLSDKLLRLCVRTERALPAFVNLVLATSASRVQVENAATGSSKSMKNISQEALREVLVPEPPLEEQARIVDALQSMTTRTNAEKESLNALRALRDALRLELLSGARTTLPTRSGVAA